MTRKKRFGSTVKVHKHRVVAQLTAERRLIKAAVHALRGGDCRGAIDGLAAAAYQAGAVSANRSGARLRRGSSRAIRGLVAKVKVCVNG